MWGIQRLIWININGFCQLLPVLDSCASLRTQGPFQLMWNRAWMLRDRNGSASLHALMLSSNPAHKQILNSTWFSRHSGIINKTDRLLHFLISPHHLDQPGGLSPGPALEGLNQPLLPLPCTKGGSHSLQHRHWLSLFVLQRGVTRKASGHSLHEQHTDTYPKAGLAEPEHSHLSLLHKGLNPPVQPASTNQPSRLSSTLSQQPSPGINTVQPGTWETHKEIEIKLKSNSKQGMKSYTKFNKEFLCLPFFREEKINNIQWAR